METFWRGEFATRPRVLAKGVPVGTAEPESDGIGANPPAPSGLAAAAARFVRRLARCVSIALCRLPRGSLRRDTNRMVSTYEDHALEQAFPKENQFRLLVAAGLFSVLVRASNSRRKIERKRPPTGGSRRSLGALIGFDPRGSDRSIGGCPGTLMGGRSRSASNIGTHFGDIWFAMGRKCGFFQCPAWSCRTLVWHPQSMFGPTIIADM